MDNTVHVAPRQNNPHVLETLYLHPRSPIFLGNLFPASSSVQYLPIFISRHLKRFWLYRHLEQVRQNAQFSRNAGRI